MKGLYSLMAGAACLVLSSAQAAGVTPNALPDGVTVSPAQGWVDTSNNANPLGVTDIAVSFTSAPAVNYDCTDLICIYVDGSDTPSETLVANQVARVDAMGYPTGGFGFNRIYNSPGSYRITVPEGVWTLSSGPSPALDLNYGIRVLQTLSPEPGLHEFIDEITLTVAGNNVQMAGGRKAPEIFKGMTDYTYTVDILEGNGQSEIVLSLDTPLSDDGDYTLLIPGGAFTYLTPDGEEISSQEIVAHYVITSFPKPAINPAEGTVSSFQKFTLTMPADFSISFGDTMGSSNIYPVKADGTLDNTPAYRVKVTSWDAEAGTVDMCIMDQDGFFAETPVEPAPGEYALKLGSVVSGTYNGSFMQCPQFTYHYTVERKAPGLVPFPLPEGIYGVSPEQGWVDTANNQNPLGVTDIALTFAGLPSVNPDCDGLICLYIDGSATPAETLVANEAVRIDHMGFPVGGFTFNRVYNTPALYRVTIPEGAWLVNGEPTPAVELNYGIRVLQELIPAPGIYDFVDEITLRVAGTNVQVVGGNKTPEFFQGITDYTYTIDIAEGDGVTDIVFSLDSPVSAAGTYTLLVPGGAFIYTTAEGEEISSQEIVAQYIISEIPQPAIEPAEGTYASFEDFTLIMPEGYSISFVDTMGASFIYAVNPDGSLDSTPVYRVKTTSFDKEANTVNLAILDEDGYVTDSPVYPADGNYALELAPSSVYGTYNGKSVGCAPFIYYYTIDSNVKVAKVTAVAGTADVYNAAGILVGRDMDQAAINALPAGLYIANGAKILVK